MFTALDNRSEKALDYIRRFLQTANRVDICVAYVTAEGVQLIAEDLKKFLEQGYRFRLLISEDNSPEDVEYLKSNWLAFPNVEVRVYPSDQGLLHAKLYLFFHAGGVHILVGSSNLTYGGLISNIEHNLAGSQHLHATIVRQWMDSYESLWSKGLPLASFEGKPRPHFEAPGGEGMEIGQPFPAGTQVTVYGRLGEVLKAESIGGNRFRYLIWFEGESRAEAYTSPPTTITSVQGPLALLAQGHLDPEIRFDLLAEAFRLSLAFEYDRMVSLSSSRVNLEPYQVEAVHTIVNAFPHRYLIADDTGLGKTIEAGMILEELTIRGRSDRVLIVTPAPICGQWKRELKRAFGRHYVIYDGTFLRELRRSLPPEQNPWDRESKIITSIDLAKRDEIRAQLERTRWDCVIIDEAHKLSARRYGMKVEETQRYKLGRLLAEWTDALLLLSATPHNGDRYAFYAILCLLDEYAFPSVELLDAKHIARITMRRTKKEILDEQGRPVFVEREVRTRPVEFQTEAEKELYRAVTEYVREGYNFAQLQQNRAVGFVMVLFQKRMVSSIEAIRRSLGRRLDALLKVRDEAVVAQLSKEEELKFKDLLEDPDSLDDRERDELERRLETLVPVLDRKRLLQEIEELKNLCRLAERVMVDSKARALLSFLEGIFAQDPSEKVIIFTEYRDTLEYLEGLIKKRWKYTVIHGRMEMPEREKNQQVLEAPETRILLATDAAGEGLNLHWACHLMINYELPWNPNRIEQRIGRLHRYGQKREVKVYNFFITNSREDQILMRLLERLEQIRTDLPGDLYDVLGIILQDYGSRRDRDGSPPSEQAPRGDRRAGGPGSGRTDQNVRALG